MSTESKALVRLLIASAFFFPLSPGYAVVLVSPNSKLFPSPILSGSCVKGTLPVESSVAIPLGFANLLLILATAVKALLALYKAVLAISIKSLISVLDSSKVFNLDITSLNDIL